MRGRLIVKCLGCGIEYSLGRKIYHSCETHEMCHGVIWEKEHISCPWNCLPIEKYNVQEGEKKNYLIKIEKLIQVAKS